MPEHEAPAGRLRPRRRRSRPAGRSRRQVADWGVGEELFDGMPGPPLRASRRRPLEGGSARRGGRRPAHDRDHRRSARPRFEARGAAAEEFAEPRGGAPGSPPARRGLGGDEPFADEPADDPSTPPLSRVRADGGEFAREARALTRSPLRADGIVRGGVEGRRTVRSAAGPRSSTHLAPAARPDHPRAARPAAGPHRRVGLRARDPADPHRHRHGEHLEAGAGARSLAGVPPMKTPVGGSEGTPRAPLNASNSFASRARAPE